MEDISTVFQYELSSIPSALFENSGLPRVAQKSLLADALWKVGDCSMTTLENTDAKNIRYVTDGGSLVQKIPWKKETTSGCICQRYHNYLQTYSNPGVVFDGYDHALQQRI